MPKFRVKLTCVAIVEAYTRDMAESEAIGCLPYEWNSQVQSITKVPEPKGIKKVEKDTSSNYVWR